jgi:hypothetical protein
MLKKMTMAELKAMTQDELEAIKPAAAKLKAPFSEAQRVERRNLIMKLSAQGWSGSAVAFFMGLQRQRIAQIRDFENFKRPPRPHIARREAIPGLIRDGMCGTDMARKFGVSHDLIYADIRTLKLSTPLKKQLLANRSRAMSDAKIKAHQERVALEAKERRVEKLKGRRRTQSL